MCESIIQCDKMSKSNNKEFAIGILQ